MFYDNKSELGKNNLFEIEIDVEDNKSILSGIVKLNEKNFMNSLNQINSNFSFGLAVQKSKRSFPYSKEKFLQQLKEIPQDERKSSKVNILKAIVKIMNENKVIFTLKSNGRDEEIISLYSKNENNFSRELNQLICMNKSMIEN